MTSQDVPSSPEYDDDSSKSFHHKKKRVGKACDSCRIKKTKCDGKKPCGKCLSDNKICVFTEKRKSKDRHHPSGYVELLETRIDLLSKSLEKIIYLSTPHLKFLQELQVEDRENIPINEVVSYLIQKEGLLKNHPIEWDYGALLAAKLPSDEEGIKKASREFAEHSQCIEHARNTQLEKHSQSNSQPKRLDTSQKMGQRTLLVNEHTMRLPPSTSLFTHASIKREAEDDLMAERIGLNHNVKPPAPLSGATSYDTSLNGRNKMISQLSDLVKFGRRRPKSMNEKLNSEEFSLGGVLSTSAILSPTAIQSSEADSDAASAKFDLDLDLPQNVHSMSQQLLSNYIDDPPQLPSQFLDSNRQPAVNFIGGGGSMTSLTNKFESHEIKSPIATSVSINSNGSLSSSIARRGSWIARSYSPSHQKILNGNHIHKPLHNHHSNSSAVNIDFVKRQNSYSSQSTQTHETAQNAPEYTLNDYKELELATDVQTLPSQAINFHSDFDSFNIIDADNIESFPMNPTFFAQS